MEYNYSQHQFVEPPQPMQQLSLPDMSCPNEKASQWTQSLQYGNDSGYTTQAPSIRSLDPANTYVNMDEQQPAQMKQPVDDMSQRMMQMNVVSEQPPQQQQQQKDYNAVDEWMNSQDNDEMALKALPDILKLLDDDDKFVVQQVVPLINIMSAKERLCQALSTPESPAVPLLVKLLVPDSKDSDLDVVKNALASLYNISSCGGKQGIQAILQANAVEPLTLLLSSNTETIINYSITTLHNLLSYSSRTCLGQIKALMREKGAIQSMVNIIQHNQSHIKLLTIAVNCLGLLTNGNSEAKLQLLETGANKLLVEIMRSGTDYPKLQFFTSRMLKNLSVCTKNKEALVEMGAVQVLGQLCLANTRAPVLQNCLLTLRNLSDAAVLLHDLGNLVGNLINLIDVLPKVPLPSHNDSCVSTATDSSNFPMDSCNLIAVAAGILSNLTSNNENNKSIAIESNCIQILLHTIHTNLGTQEWSLIDPCVCVLRHVTNPRHTKAVLTNEQMRAANGIPLAAHLLTIQSPRKWPVIKATLGLIRNLCTDQLNAKNLRENCIIEKVMQALYDAFMQVHANGGNNCKIDDVSMLDIVDIAATTLHLLARDLHNHEIIIQLECIKFFNHLFTYNLISIQRVGSGLLADLAVSRDCAFVIDRLEGLHQFVQANFCNPSGHLKKIADITPSSTQAITVLQNVTTLIQRLDEHKAAFNQQQALLQRQQQMFQQQQQIPPTSIMHQQQQQMPCSQMVYPSYPPQQPPSDQYGSMLLDTQQQQFQQHNMMQQQPSMYPGVGPGVQQQQYF